MVVVVGYKQGTTPTFAVTDTAGNTYQADQVADLITGNTAHVKVFSSILTAALVSGNSITCTCSVGNMNRPIIEGYEYSGVAATSWKDQSAGATGTGTAVDSSAITTTTARELLISATDMDQNPTWTPTAPAALLDLSQIATTNALASNEAIVAATGTYNGQGTLGTSRAWASAIVSYKQAPSAFVQEVVAAGTAVNDTTLVLTLSGITTTVGNHLILCAASRGGVVTGVADSKGNTWQVDKTDTVTGASTGIASCKIGTALVNGDTITITNSSSTGHSASVAEYTGLATSSWFDQSASSNGTGTAADSTATSTTSQASEVVVGVVGHQSTVTAYVAEVLFPVWNLNTSAASVSTVQTVRPMYRDVIATGTFSAKSSWTTSRIWSAAVATYKMASAATGSLVYNPNPLAHLRAR